MTKTDQPTVLSDLWERIKSTFKPNTKPSHLCKTDKYDGSVGRALWTLGWGSKRKTRPQRPEGLCGPLFFVTLKEKILLMWPPDRSRMDLSATTKVWMHKATICCNMLSKKKEEALDYISIQRQIDYTQPDSAKTIWKKSDKSHHSFQ